MQLEKMKEQNQKFSQPAEAKAYTVEGPRLTQWRGQSLHSGGAKAYTVEGPRLTQWRGQGLHSGGARLTQWRGQGLHNGGAKAYTVEGPRLTVQWRSQALQSHNTVIKDTHKPRTTCTHICLFWESTKIHKSPW
jgi:hypothetical protein